MNTIHQIVLEKFRSTKEYSKTSILSDEQLLRKLFLNYRPQAGIRLTLYGLNILSNFYNGIELPLNKKPTVNHILFLENNSKFPYYITDKHIITFDNFMGFRLKLVDGDLALLVQTNSGKIFF